MNTHNDAVLVAESILSFRRHRSERLPSELFAEPAWDLLLELFVADAHGVRLTGREVADRIASPYSVMSRWLIYITDEGLLVGDGSGDLDDPLTLSGPGMDHMEYLLAHAGIVRDRSIIRPQP